MRKVKDYLFDGIVVQKEIAKQHISIEGALALSWFAKLTKKKGSYHYFNESDGLYYYQVDYSHFHKENPIFSSKSRKTMRRYFMQISCSNKNRNLPLIKKEFIDPIEGSRVSFAFNPMAYSVYLSESFKIKEHTGNV